MSELRPASASVSCVSSAHGPERVSGNPLPKTTDRAGNHHRSERTVSHGSAPLDQASRAHCSTGVLRSAGSPLGPARQCTPARVPQPSEQKEVQAAVGGSRPTSAKVAASHPRAATAAMSSIASLVSELDLAISACVGQGSSSGSSDALVELRQTIVTRQHERDFEKTHIRRDLQVYHYRRGCRRSSHRD